MIYQDICAVILAGGKNSRLNYEKSMLHYSDNFFIQHQIKLLKQIFPEVIVVTEKKEILFLELDVLIVKDKFAGCGPSGGIHAAMSEYKFSEYFVFACDMPFIDKEIICKIIDEHLKNDSDITIPQHAEGVEPLHAIYNHRALQFLDRNLSSGKYHVRAIFPYLKVCYLAFMPEEIRYFFNINTPKDLKLFAQMAKVELLEDEKKLFHRT